MKVKTKNTVASIIFWIVLLLFFFGVVLLCSEVYAADWVVYAKKPDGKIINYRPYADGMNFGKIPIKNCVIIPIKDASKAEMEQLKINGRYVADWAYLDIKEPDIDNTLCRDISIRHQPLLDKKVFTNLSKELAFFDTVDKKWVGSKALGDASVKTLSMEDANAEKTK